MQYFVELLQYLEENESSSNQVRSESVHLVTRTGYGIVIFPIRQNETVTSSCCFSLYTLCQYMAMIGHFTVLRFEFAISRPFAASTNAMDHGAEVHSSAHIGRLLRTRNETKAKFSFKTTVTFVAKI